jgi:hypothetical protein
MSIMTFDAGHAVAGEAPVAAQPAKQKSWFARALARMVAARQRQAMAEVRRYGVVLPRELDRLDWQTGERSEDSLPFNR